MHQLKYLLEDFPLFTDENGFGYGTVNGTAFVDFDSDDGFFAVVAATITAERYDAASERWVSNEIKLSENSLEFKNIQRRLEDENLDAPKVLEAIDQYLIKNGYELSPSEPYYLGQYAA